MDESVVREFEQQQVGKLKLSQAIRIGAQLRPKCRLRYFDLVKEGDGLVTGSCALGAAWEALGMRGEPQSYDDVCGVLGISEALATIIGRRNDNGYTREQIADWLEAQGL